MPRHYGGGKGGGGAEDVSLALAGCYRDQVEPEEPVLGRTVWGSSPEEINPLLIGLMNTRSSMGGIRTRSKGRYHPTPQWVSADAEIKGPSVENAELKRSPFRAWSRSVSRDFFFCLFLPFRSIHQHFFQNLSRFLCLCWLWLTPVLV